jgi:hypothetical protein
MPPTHVSTAPSIASWTIRCDRPAPIATRVSNSRTRALPRATSKVDTLTIAISSTTAAMPMTIHNGSEN